MPRPKLPDWVKASAGRIYLGLQHQAQQQGRTVSAAWVHQVFCQEHEKGIVSLRKVSDWVKEWKENAPATDDDWYPWRSDIESSEDIELLLDLQFEFRVFLGRSLSMRDAIWGRKLRVLIRGLPPVARVLVVSLYSIRERLSQLLDQELQTADLDAWLVVRPRQPEKYPDMVDNGFLPRPPRWSELLVEIGAAQDSENLSAFKDYYGRLMNDEEGDVLSYFANMHPDLPGVLFEGAISQGIYRERIDHEGSHNEAKQE